MAALTRSSFLETFQFSVGHKTVRMSAECSTVADPTIPIQNSKRFTSTKRQECQHRHVWLVLECVCPHTSDTP